MNKSKYPHRGRRIPIPSTVFGLLFFVYGLLSGRTASALDASGVILFGYAPTDMVFDAIPVGYNAGVGARAGLTLPINVYAGGTFVYHLGAHPGEDTWTNVWYFGAEGGYDIAAGAVTIRPYVGAGYANWHVDARNLCSFFDCGGGVQNRGRFAWWPGAAVLVDVGSRIFLGGDLRYVMIPDLFEANSLGGFVTSGMHFW